MRTVDTHVLVRLITRDDANQAASADAFVQRGAWESVLALAEATSVLSAVYERNAADLATAVAMLLDDKDLTLQDPDVVAAALDLFRSRPSAGFSDCLMLQLVARPGIFPWVRLTADLERSRVRRSFDDPELAGLVCLELLRCPEISVQPVQRVACYLASL